MKKQKKELIEGVKMNEKNINRKIRLTKQKSQNRIVMTRKIVNPIKQVRKRKQ